MGRGSPGGRGPGGGGGCVTPARVLSPPPRGFWGVRSIAAVLGCPFHHGGFGVSIPSRRFWGVRSMVSRCPRAVAKTNGAGSVVSHPKHAGYPTGNVAGVMGAGAPRVPKSRGRGRGWVGSARSLVWVVPGARWQWEGSGHGQLGVLDLGACPIGFGRLSCWIRLSAIGFWVCSMTGCCHPI